MIRRPRSVAAISPVGLALVAVAGTWMGHTMEYLRVTPGGSAFRSVHTYMGPVGAVLLAAALIGMRATAAAIPRLEQHLRTIRSGAPARPAVETTGAVLGLPALAGVLWVWQCALYLVQENAEQLAAHRPPPGWGPLIGVHSLAPVVHLGVALVLGVVVWVARRRVTALVVAIRVAEARLSAGWAAPAPVAVLSARRTWTPRERWGVHLWSRPPPAVA